MIIIVILNYMGCDKVLRLTTITVSLVDKLRREGNEFKLF